MTTLAISTLIDSIVVLMTEAYAGPPDPSSTWFIDNEPNSGILGILEDVSASEASFSVDGSGHNGTTIAANAEHLRWSLASANAALRGETYQGNWKESWNLLNTDQPAWDRLRQALRSEFETLLLELKKQSSLPGDALNGVLGLIPHAAYHLGTIRQMKERARAAKTIRPEAKSVPVEKAGDLPGKLSQPALRALHTAGCQRLEQVAALSEPEVSQLHGIGPNAIAQLRRALAEAGLSFASKLGRKGKRQ